MGINNAECRKIRNAENAKKHNEEQRYRTITIQTELMSTEESL